MRGTYQINHRCGNITAIIVCSAVLLVLLPQADVLAASKMYWTDWSNSKIQRANLDGTNAENFVIAGYPFGIALDIAAGEMYWTDWVSDKIQRANLDGSGVQDLVTAGLHMPYGIALDVLRGRMYWADAGSNIKRANLDGSGVEDLFILGVDSPRGITLDVAGGKMYWTDDNGRIQRANLDGSGAEDLITSLTSPSGIALDIAAGKIYWTENIASDAKIRRANLDGDNVQTLVTDADGLYWPCGIALDVAAGKMYWTDYDTGKIQRANLDGTQVEDLIIDLDTPFGIALDTASEIMTVYYVDDDAPGSNNGTSWTNALNDLQDALSIAAAYPQVEQILVAQGTYKPDQGFGITPGDRSATFQLINGVTIKGGYAGYSEPDPNARYIKGYETILSGDLDGNDGPDFANNEENSYHVVTGSDCNETAVLDGFTITAGNADGPYPDPENFGGGMYNHSGSPTVTNCTFSENSANIGGGMCNDSSSPTVTNCTFSENSANTGGGMHNHWSSSPTLTNCIFSENSAADDGGGIRNRNSSSPTLTNCIFSGNSAADDGGGIRNGGGIRDGDDNCNPMLVNCTFSKNSVGGLGGGMYSWAGSPILTNCILWANIDSGGSDESAQIHTDGGGTPVIDYSCIQGWTGDLGGTGNIGDDPLFMDPDGDYHLQPVSPCIDAGDNDAVPLSVTTDLDGSSRFVDDPCIPDTGSGTPPIVDMGAYESLGLAFTDCYPGNALWFDGTDDYVGLPDNNPIWLPENNFTLSVWVYFEREAGSLLSEYILDLNHGDSRVDNNELGYGLIRIGNTGKIKFSMTTTNTDEDLSSDDVLVKDKWYHIVAVRDGTTQAIYIDGLLNKSRMCSPDPIDFVGDYDDDKVNIGRFTRSGGEPDNYHLKGVIDEVVIFDRALSAEEIQQIYRCGCIADSNLVGYWNFDESWGQAVYDMSVNANDGYLGTDPAGPDDHDPIRVESGIPNREYYVDDDSPYDPASGVPGAFAGEFGLSDPLENGTLCHPYDSIQKAIDYYDNANKCATIIVLDGTYTGIGNYNIDPNGLALTIKSENSPKDCIIDCQNQGRAFIFQTGEEPNTIIDGFTITNGYTNRNGGAIFCDASSPTIQNCIITGNYTKWSGGGIWLQYNSNALIRRCTISNNDSDVAGAITSYASDPTIENCLMFDNFGLWSGALTSSGNSNSTIINCTIADNIAIRGPGGLECFDAGNLTVINSILWDNIGGQIFEEQGTVSVAYSNVQMLDSNDLITDYNWPGAGNINADPLFADPNIRDYHLKSIAGRWTPVLETNGDFNNDGIIDWFDLEIFVLYWLNTGPQIIADLYVDNSVDFKDYAILAANWLSPGNNISGWVYSDQQISPSIDAGDPNSVYSLEPEPNGSRINMGAYGNTKHASKSP